MLIRMKTWALFLLTILIASMLCACGNSASETPSTSDTPLAVADKVEVVYFHRAQRCNSCIYAETGTRHTLETYFKDELASNELTFKAVNFEDKESAAIVKKYGAFTSSLFINTIRDGTDYIDEVKEIWFFVGNDKAFVEVVKSKIEESLEEIR
ncbi:nitrophenyl compound nitroreductase subunit ArsF family protein [Chloroflexota bacterium]